jgi:nucleotide-binding universal stress UspA family protein
MSGATTPMPGSIICAVDGSEPAKGAIRVARDLGALLGRRLVFVRVVERGTPPERIDAIAGRLRQLAERENHWSIAPALWLVDVGHPADRLVAAAEDEQASVIVLGSHGPRSSLLGSISADVSRVAPCPVVVVPPAANAAANGTDDRQLAGGIARFKLGGGGTDFAGGIARFSLGSRESGG